MNINKISEFPFNDALKIFYWVAFFTYNQSLIIFFWDLNSLLLRFSLNDIMGFLSYQLVFSFLESLVVTLVVFVILFLIPIKYVKQNVSLFGIIAIISIGLSRIIFIYSSYIAIWLTNTLKFSDGISQQIVSSTWIYTVAGLPITLIYLTKKNQRLKSTFIKIIDNLSVLVNIYVFLSVIGLIIVILRNLI